MSRDLSHRLHRGRTWLTVVLAVGCLCVALPARAATFALRVNDASGTGFNDPSAFTPIGGNNATTLGQARRNVFNEAGRLWGLKLVGTQTIVIEASFTAQSCSPSSGTLSSTGPTNLYSNFTNAPLRDVLYPKALADQLAGQNIDPSSSDITSQINSNVDASPLCLGGNGFYYGFDHQPGNKVDLLNVLMHEFAHGLGFTSNFNESTGTGALAIYDQFIFDETLQKFWPQLNALQRVLSAINTGNLTWNAPHTNGAAFNLTAGVHSGHVQLYAPNPNQPGSSVSHWDTAATPDLLMEPFASSTVNASVGVDLTSCLLADLGWTLGSGIRCPDGFGTPANTPPVADAQSVDVAADSSVAITLTGHDADNNSLTFQIVSLPTHGTLSGTPPEVTYAPAHGYTGEDSFTFKVNDGQADSAPATVSVTVDAAPSAALTGAVASAAPVGSGSGSSSGAGGGGALTWAPGLLLAALLRRHRSRRDA